MIRTSSTPPAATLSFTAPKTKLKNSFHYQMKAKVTLILPGQYPLLVVGITCLSISSNKRYAAIAERGLTNATASIFDLNSLRKRKVLIATEFESKVALIRSCALIILGICFLVLFIRCQIRFDSNRWTRLEPAVLVVGEGESHGEFQGGECCCW